MIIQQRLRDAFKGAGNNIKVIFASKGAAASWKCLMALVGVLGRAGESLAPVKATIDIFVGSVDIYEEAAKGRRKYALLRIRLEALFDVLRLYIEEEHDSTPTVTKSVECLCRSIEEDLNLVKSKWNRHGWKRYLDAKDEEDEIFEHYNRVAEHLDRLKLNADLSTWKIVDLHATEDRLARMFSRASGLSPTLPARYNSAMAKKLKRRGCTPGTRVNALETILDWTHLAGNKTVYWLNGMAGTGKTTIAYSVCAKLDTESKLAATFFCSRLQEECRNVNLIFPSISYQLARFSWPFLSALSDILKEDPDAHSLSLHMQFEFLIAKPLRRAQPTLPLGLVVVIDGLDECEKDANLVTDILDILLKKAPELSIKFLVSSRPEPEIRDQMTEDRVSWMVLHELDKSGVQTDIEKYIQVELAPMCLSKEQVAELAAKANILFIYAAMAVRYIGYDNFQSNPSDRLRVILEGPQLQEEEGTEEIDQLYTTILEAAFGDRRRRRVERDIMQQVLYAVICACEPLTVAALSVLLQIHNVVHVQTALRPLWSVLQIHVSEASGLATTAILHTSFREFLFSSTRASVYYCDQKVQHHKMAEYCLELIKRTQLRLSACDVDLFSPDEKAPNLKERMGHIIPTELSYACQYWAEHIKAGNCALDMVEQLQDFLSAQLPIWVEVLNFYQKSRTGIEQMKLTIEWGNQLGERKLVELAHNAQMLLSSFSSNSA